MGVLFARTHILRRVVFCVFYAFYALNAVFHLYYIYFVYGDYFVYEFFFLPLYIYTSKKIIFFLYNVFSDAISVALAAAISDAHLGVFCDADYCGVFYGAFYGVFYVHLSSPDVDYRE